MPPKLAAHLLDEYALLANQPEPAVDVGEEPDLTPRDRKGDIVHRDDISVSLREPSCLDHSVPLSAAKPFKKISTTLCATFW